MSGPVPTAIRGFLTHLLPKPPPLAFWARVGTSGLLALLVSLTCILGYTLAPFGLHGLPAAGLGFLMAMVILLAELRLRRAQISGLLGGAIGAVLGLLA